MDFVAGEVLLLDKPMEWTSFDVVNKIRISLKPICGKLKVGHAGTLDPLATGLLIICTGKKTKEIDSYQAQDKTYTGTITLGMTTPTYDAEMPADAHFETSHITADMILATAQKFVGEIEQVPPVYSAVKVDGKKAYVEKRRGNEIELKKRTVTIFDFQITKIEMPVVSFSVKCSKGTYIRSLAFDFGKALDSGAFLSSLRREKIGDFDVANAWKLTDFLTHLKEIEDKISV